MQETDNILYVKCFKNFSAVWNGEEIMRITKSSETQFFYLMQLLLHNRTQGVSRTQMMNQMFSDRDVKNASHSLHVLLYNAKKKLKKMGLPDVDYFVKKEGNLYWTSEIPVVEDATEFERLYREADQESDEKKKVGLYLEACELYTGEFLPMQSDSLWVANELRRYNELFAKCVEKAAVLLKKEKDYVRLESLGYHAAKSQPFYSWERVTLEALIGLERFRDARQFYNKTEEFYYREMKLPPDECIMELWEKIGLSLRPSNDMLASIQEQLSVKEGDQSGGHICNYTEFQHTYEMVQSLIQRGGHSVYLMLCTLVDDKGKPADDENLSARLREVVAGSVRRTDVICQYGVSQYLILLLNSSYENSFKVQIRIDKKMKISGRKYFMSYYVGKVEGSKKKTAGSDKR